MLSKVSMVLPCYNAVKYISNMFDSIIAQKWDNIEVIMVNDGSDDGTREVIAGYETKFLERGFEVVIVDQENKGVASAVFEGLKRATGEFICTVDADDELTPEYVSTMAGCLAERPEVQWVACDASGGNWDKESHTYVRKTGQYQEIEEYPYKPLEAFLLLRIARAVWHLMFRKTYMITCGLLNDFIVETRITQEPQILIPLALGGSKPVHIRRPLYKYFARANSLSRAQHTYKEILEHLIIPRSNLTEKCLASKKNLDTNERALLAIGRLIFMNTALRSFLEYNELSSTQELIKIISETDYIKYNLDIEIASQFSFPVLARWFSNKAIGYIPQSIPIRRNGDGRIIAYAAFGKAASEIKAELVNSDIRPDIFWDITAMDGDAICGIPVVKPDFKSLRSNDIPLILLKNMQTVKAVDEQFQNTPAKDNIMYYYDVMDYLTEYYLDREDV